MTNYRSVDDYIAAQSASARSVLERVRATIRRRPRPFSTFFVPFEPLARGSDFALQP
jgi:hypothetical protein